VGRDEEVAPARRTWRGRREAGDGREGGRRRMFFDKTCKRCRKFLPGCARRRGREQEREEQEEQEEQEEERL